MAIVLTLSGGVRGAEHCPDRSPLGNAYFGDLHTHTSYSFDAWDYGTRTDPATAYAFARGARVDVAGGADPLAGQVGGPSGVTIDTSGGNLDFVAVTDHAEFLGTMQGCTVNAGAEFHDDPYCAALRSAPNPDFLDPSKPNWVLRSPCYGTNPNGGGSSAAACVTETTSAWAAERVATTAAYAPCQLTTFHAFEWSGVDLRTTPFGTLHRNVFFANEQVPALPIDFVSYGSSGLGPRALWAALAEQCPASTGCEAITIPHNSNQSRGAMFDFAGYAPEDVARMARYQRLAEIHQHKGNSECLTDTADDGAVTTCDFELETGDTDAASAPGYVRPALERGLAQFAGEKLDPLQLGFVGATDTHDATPGNVGETSWPGHSGLNDNTPARRLTRIGGQNPGGLTGVWAEENTREAIWAALMRREVFATSGPRIRVRFYAFTGPMDPCTDPDFPAQLVAAGGVPMGGTLVEPGSIPRFVVYALPDAAPLAAVDLVNARVVDGEVVERVHTIPLAGAPACVTWTDPAFTRTAPAFWYARVREQPTPRWSHYDCARLQQSNPGDWQTIAPGCASSDPAAGGLDVTIQERAWTSPIWYLPGTLVTVPTTSLRLRDGSARARRFRFDAVTTGGRIVVPARLGAGAPPAGGATLTVYNSAGSGEVARIALPAAGWHASRRGTRLTYRSRDPDGAIQKVLVATDRITIRGGHAGWSYALGERPQGRIAVRLLLGGGTLWCADAPAAPGSDTHARFVATRGAPPPDVCPAVGATTL
ncbi:MAG: DUF3604 domain-containing protein [Candidatus Binatia bacterium]